MKKICIIFVVILVILTVLICAINPQPHKQAVITDSQYVFVEEAAPVADVSTKIVPQPVKEQAVKVAPKTVVKPVETKKTTVYPKQIQTKLVKTQTKPAQKIQTVVKKVETPQQKVTTTVKELPKPVEQKQQITPIEQPKQHVLTEQEEIIAWNKWRSDLQNQVMRDTKIAAPLGTGFKFSFTVDKFGNLSNVKVWSLNSAYTDYAVRVIKPVLMSYKGKPILNFPEGTKRIITNVTGGFAIATSTEYSTPSDYSDYETVRTRK